MGGGEGEGSAEDTRTSTKAASNKGWKHEGENISEGKNERKKACFCVRAPKLKNKMFFISLCAGILILGCITKQLYSLVKTNKQNKPCQQHK